MRQLTETTSDSRGGGTEFHGLIFRGGGVDITAVHGPVQLNISAPACYTAGGVAASQCRSGGTSHAPHDDLAPCVGRHSHRALGSRSDGAALRTAATIPGTPPMARGSMRIRSMARPALVVAPCAPAWATANASSSPPCASLPSARHTLTAAYALSMLARALARVAAATSPAACCGERYDGARSFWASPLLSWRRVQLY